ncbi:MAG: HlyD family efflux transporter periplasmic adaptor subunit [Planctomycetes bacterium]|nr:HlyD family efflux transporter periplasmic adaptor subunit [Planctomycetota bacterium]
MIRKLFLPVLGFAGFVFAVTVVVQGSAPIKAAPAVSEPAKAAFSQFVAGAGLIEAQSENIAIGTPVPGVVMEVAVTPGTGVKKGDLLFRLDDRSLRAELSLQLAQLEVARAQLTRLENKPAAESKPAALARVEDAEVAVKLAAEQLGRLEKTDTRSVTTGELDNARLAVAAAQAKLNIARADAAAWRDDIKVAQAQIAQAQARVDATKVALSLLEIRAPISGQILQVKVRAGEFAPTGALAQPLVTLGAVEKLHVRVDIDENDAWRIAEGARAKANARGNAGLAVELRFERIEPLVVPKRSLTGDATERVDTRVLQVIFSFERGEKPLYVGQQMDVTIEVK